MMLATIYLLLHLPLDSEPPLTHMWETRFKVVAVAAVGTAAVQVHTVAVQVAVDPVT
jgi:hypothetical protein